jgi:hypothetical protein
MHQSDSIVGTLLECQIPEGPDFETWQLLITFSTELIERLKVSIICEEFPLNRFTSRDAGNS